MPDTTAILLILGAIVFAKPMLLVFGGLLVAGAVRATGGGHGVMKDVHPSPQARSR